MSSTRSSRRHTARGVALLAGAAFLAAPALPLSAQTFPTNDPVIKRIWALGMDSSHTETLAQQLLDSVGPRLIGTPGSRSAAEWARARYTEWGIPSRDEQFGTWRGWRRGYSHIDLLTPRVRTLDATMLGYSPGTGGKNLDAELVILPRFADSTEFVKWLPSARGKFILVSAPQPTCRPRADWAENATPDSRARMDSLRTAVAREWSGPNVRGTGYSLAIGTGELGIRLEEGGVAGVITSRAKDAWGAIEIFETYNKRAPAIAVSCEDYGLLFRLTENGQKPRVRMNLDSQLMGEQPVFNTIAEIRGSEKPDEYVLLSAHFDSWDGSSGATDNGTGTLTMMEAMRILKQVYPNPRRTILVGHWMGEENGLVGSRAFSEDHPEVVNGLQALFNQDNGTGRVVRLGGGGMVDGVSHLSRWMATVPLEFNAQVSFTGAGTPSGGGSDDASFACHGAPAFGLGALGWNYGSYTWHTNIDTYDKVVFDDLKKNATLTAMLAYLASEDPTTMGRTRVDLAAMAARAPQSAAAGPQRPAPTWPTCEKAPRSTRARLK